MHLLARLVVARIRALTEYVRLERYRLVSRFLRWSAPVIAGAVLTTGVFALSAEVRGQFFGVPSYPSVVGRLDQLETAEMRLAAFSPIDLDGFGARFGVALLVPRELDRLLVPDAQRHHPVLLLVEEIEWDLVEVYRFEPDYVMPEDAELAASLYQTATFVVADIDGDGRQEVVTKWETIGANRAWLFATVTELVSGEIRTIGALPGDYEVERNEAWRYRELLIRNRTGSGESFVAHSVDDVHVVPGRLLVGIRTEMVCGACNETWELAVVESKPGGFGYDPVVVDKHFIRTPDEWQATRSGGRVINRSNYYASVSGLSLGHLVATDFDINR